MIKFLPVGKGDPAGAAAYVVSDVDHLNIKRAGVKVLRGDPQIFAALAKSSEHKNCYTSAVVAWHLDDAPTDEDINEVLNEFEQHAFAGLEAQQYHMTVVQHDDDDGSKHVHILVPRIELTSGKSLNIAPPGHHKYFDVLRDYFNIKKNWARPDVYVPKNIEIQPHVHHQHAAALRVGFNGKTKKDRLQLINHFVETRILAGQITNRATLISALEELGEITRPGKDYISLKTENFTDRLRGEFYHEQFSITAYIENRSREKNAAGASADITAISTAEFDRVHEYRNELEKFRKKRHDYNREYYAIKQQVDRESERECQPELEVSTVPVATVARDQAVENTIKRSRANDLFIARDLSVSPNTTRRTEYCNFERPEKQSSSCEYIERGFGYAIGINIAQSARFTNAQSRVDGATATVTTKNTNRSRSLDSHIIRNMHIHFLSGDQYETYDRARQIETRKNSAARIGNTNAETAAQSAAEHRKRIECYTEITTDLSRKIATVDQRIRDRVEQQKQFDPKLSKRAIEGQISTRLERFNERLKTSFSRAAAKLFKFFRNDSADQHKSSEGDPTVLIASTTHRLNQLFKIGELRHNIDGKIQREIKSTGLSSDRINRLCHDYKKISWIEKLKKKPQYTLQERLQLLKQQNSWIDISKSEKHAKKADDLFNDMYNATKSYYSSQMDYTTDMTVFDYRDHLDWSMKAICSQLSKFQRKDLEMLEDYLNTIKRYNELIELRQQHFLNKEDYRLLDERSENSLENFKYYIKQRKEELVPKAPTVVSSTSITEPGIGMTPKSIPKEEVDQGWDFDFK